MESESKPNKPRYDITMSRRTRKAHPRVLFGEKVSALKDDDELEIEEEKRKKHLIEIFNEEEAECRSSLGERFTEEDKEHQLVVKHEKGHDGVSLKKMVSRCAKMWGHLIKVKGGSRKKRVLHLTM
ncbi:uncharacterized protein LOC112520455 [Cynara cardunculus var. scolymus]|uniref:Uncharacterized protein n=1 Tax=Cynara cardunculus var. scolymus TaxID=59895 RepID=A0A118K008_CYNCS|nr:uncharacterized protein LOC112520455 [Cynara cardunculus var. scolymus]KVI00615.1 hypothetical protein Ccrd_021131 [Cynara cardunculus var. scolymus]